MVQALGYSNEPFRPFEPGRLCRGRERWITSFPNENEEEKPSIHRLMVSGAVFSDDSAKDAQRGIEFSGFTLGEAVLSFFDEYRVVAWAEESHPRKVPRQAMGVEHYEVTRPGESLRKWACRWSMNCTDPDSVNRAVDAGADVLLLMNDQQQAAAEKIDEQSAKEELHEVALADHHVDDAKGPSSLGGLNEALTKALFLLTAHRQEGQPGRYFQAAAILDVLQHCEALALVHQDKHGPCFGFYSPEPVLLVPQLEALAVQRELLAVPFAIPPMLARWDRAIWELRQDWDEGAKGPFPVPISEISRVRIERQEEREAKELAKIQLKAAEE